MASRVLARVPRLLHPMATTLPCGPWGAVQHPHPLPLTHARPMHSTQVTRLKEIRMEDSGDTLTVEGQYLPSPNAGRLLTHEGEEKARACPLCALNLDVKHTDVLILSQFMTRDGGVLPRRVTGLCGRQQRRVNWLILMAQKAGLMPNLAPANSKRDPKRRFGSKKYNRYFDEDTLPK